MTTLPQAGATEVRDRRRVLTLSTAAFTLMFAVWLMFGIPGLPIRQEFGLTDVQLSWLTAVAVLNGSFWCLPAGIITDRLSGKRVLETMLLTAMPCFLIAQMQSCPALLFFVGVSMGVGKAVVYKHIPEYFPEDVGAVGGLVGLLGGFFLTPMFAYVKNALGFPQRTFFAVFVMTLISVVWMQLTIM